MQQNKNPQRAAGPARRKAPMKKQKNKHNKAASFLGYLCIFALVFFGALYGLSFAIKSYSREIGTSEIGVNEVFSLNTPEPAEEIRTIDERLKLIQEEDDLPSVSIKREEKAAKDAERKKAMLQKNTDEIYLENGLEKTPEEKNDLKPPMPKISEIKKEHSMFGSIPAKEVVPMPKRIVTRVYLGGYPSKAAAEDVMAGLVKVIEPGTAPFIKQVNGYYIVQLGIFTDADKAENLSQKIRALGYYPKISSEI